MKATIHFWCEPADADATYDAEDIRITVFLPFMPQAGMLLKVTAGGDFYKVDEVFWDITEPDEITVVFEEPDDTLQDWPTMQEQGWRIL